MVKDQFTDLSNESGIGIEKLYISGSWLSLKPYLQNHADPMKTVGTDADDVIHGIEIANQNDEINAGEGDDVISGDAGNDILRGGNGNDAYLFASGDGHDVIEDDGGFSDTIRFLEGISSSNLTLTRENE